MEVRKLKPNEVSNFKSLVKIFKNVFDSEEEIAGNEHLGKLLVNPDFIAFVIRLNNKVVGGLTIYILHRYFGRKPIAYIYDVGIKSGLQGQGLGRALIAEVCKFCKENNFEDAHVEAESDDIDAVNFYRKTKYSTEMNTIQFTYTFNYTN